MAKLTKDEIKERVAFLETRRTVARKEKDKILKWFKREMGSINLVEQKVIKGEFFAPFEKAYEIYLQSLEK